MTLSNGKLETKKARDKRMVEHRRMLKEQEKLAKDQEKLMPSPVQPPKGISNFTPHLLCRALLIVRNE
jgi:hypothetical protein